MKSLRGKNLHVRTSGVRENTKTVGKRQLPENGRSKSYGGEEPFRIESVTLAALDAQLAKIGGRQ
jgi:hypothetical protein